MKASAIIQKTMDAQDTGTDLLPIYSSSCVQSTHAIISGCTADAADAADAVAYADAAADFR